jgi:hypothetical protein
VDRGGPTAEEASPEEIAPRPTGSLATKTLAEIYLAQGYRDKALAVLHQILEHHPERQDIRDQIADIERTDTKDQTEPAPETRPGPSERPPRPGRSRQHFESWIERISRKSDQEE